MPLLILLITLLSPATPGWSDEVAPGIYRTPEARFEDLQGYPFAPHYQQIGAYRIHYLDEGPANGAPVFLLHGEPTWSYLYRKMIPVFTAAGYRVIVPDLVGFGKSDKPARKDDYSYQMQVDVMLELVEQLDLQETTFFGQDWGGLIGLRVVAAVPQRFARVVVSNTGLPGADGIGGMVGYPLFRLAVWWQGPITLQELQNEVSFLRWVAYNHNVDDMPVGELMGLMGAEEAVIKAYEAPFPDRRYKSAAQAMPYLVPSQLQENAAAWQVFENWDKPFLVAFSDSDPITQGGDRAFIERVPNAQSVTIKGAGHFVQEDAGVVLAQLIVDFIAGNELPNSVESD